MDRGVCRKVVGKSPYVRCVCSPFLSETLALTNEQLQPRSQALSSLPPFKVKERAWDRGQDNLR